MKEYLEKIKAIAEPIILQNELYLFRIHESNEFGVNSIRIIVDKENSLDVDIDKVAQITEAILDQVNDLIPDNYYLEVTTRGIERELETDDDINLAVGKYVMAKLYEKNEILNDKEIYGTLVSFENDLLTLDVKIKTRRKQIILEKNKIAKIRLAVEF